MDSNSNSNYHVAATVLALNGARVLLNSPPLALSLCLDQMALT